MPSTIPFALLTAIALQAHQGHTLLCGDMELRVRKKKEAELATQKGTLKRMSRPKSLQHGAAFLAAGLDPSCHMDADWYMASYACLV